MIDTSVNLVISKSNEVFLKINTEPHIEYELRDHFKFEVPNAKFMPQYRGCLLYTSPSPRDRLLSRMPSSA